MTFGVRNRKPHGEGGTQAGSGRMSRSPLGHREEKSIFPGLGKRLCMKDLAYGVH